MRIFNPPRLTPPKCDTCGNRKELSVQYAMWVCRGCIQLAKDEYRRTHEPKLRRRP